MYTAVSEKEIHNSRRELTIRKKCQYISSVSPPNTEASNPTFLTSISFFTRITDSFMRLVNLRDLLAIILVKKIKYFSLKMYKSVG